MFVLVSGEERNEGCSPRFSSFRRGTAHRWRSRQSSLRRVIKAIWGDTKVAGGVSIAVPGGSYAVVFELKSKINLTELLGRS
jgi:hypothetical protein